MISFRVILIYFSLLPVLTMVSDAYPKNISITRARTITQDNFIVGLHVNHNFHKYDAHLFLLVVNIDDDERYLSKGCMYIPVKELLHRTNLS